MASKMSLGNPYELPHREQLKKELNEMLLKKQAAIIKKIKPEKDLDDQEWVWDEPHEEMRPHPPKPKLWYLIAVLKKTGISLEQVGDNMGLSFLGNIIYQFKLLNPGSCNYVCFLYNYFQKVSPIDWPAKNAMLKKLTKSLPKMKQTRNKAEKSFNKWWLVANSGVPHLNSSLLRCSFTLYPHSTITTLGCGVYPTINVV